ncbi:MAG: hypothetical protein QOI55_3029, partial [Actinomycetota bacterium]|nr:hypothetical protein [Actinomycetota bacterium]
MTVAAPPFTSFRARAEQVVNEHPVVMRNEYTRWFARGEATVAEVRHLT